MLAGDVVFSKIPLENITETHLVDAWSWNYSYMKILCEECGSWVDLFVIHTAAPISYKNFNMRNNQINKLKSDFIKQQNVWTPTMIIWDFNLSPWSYYYKQLVKNRNMKNSLSFQSPNYTRSLLQQWIFRSHIDQLFISPEIRISNIKIENLSWSDHRSFTFSFWTKS
jgi:endonuclease/exonuclease/phosphatase (EEP) superfamily protein YafD